MLGNLVIQIMILSDKVRLRQLQIFSEEPMLHNLLICVSFCSQIIEVREVES